ncbi:MAG: hypothetical protein JSV44_04710, partial [Candidatus Zixiibacteriota bacterium]
MVLQFACSILLIIGAGVVYRQLSYMENKDIGYDKEYVINISLTGDSVQRYAELKNELNQNSRIVRASGIAAGMPYFSWTTGSVDWDGKDPDREIQVSMNYIDYDFIETLDIELVDGRSFSREFVSDAAGGYLVNEAMVRLMGLESAVGARLTYIDRPGKIIGVMKDFHFRPLDSPIGPLVFVLVPEAVKVLSIRIPPGDIPASLAVVEEIWERICPEYPFAYEFFDQVFDRRYRGIEIMGNLAGSFALVAVFIACLGLLGLVSFAAEQRTREIGIRKVLGASVSSIMGLLSGEFLVLVAIANVIAWPIAYLAMNRWLQYFAYHTELNWVVFIFAAV